MNLTDAYDYCKDVTHRHGPNFSLGFIFLPKAKRRAVYAAYAFCRYADDIVDEAAAAQSMEMRLKIWTDGLDRAYDGDATHPILIALADSVTRFDIPKQPFIDLIEGCRIDLTIDRYATFDDLMEYCRKVAGTISTISLSIFGYSEERALELGDSLSTALQLTNIARDVGDDLERGRIYLPLEDLERFGVTEADLSEALGTPEIKNLLEFELARISEYFDEAERLIPLIDKDARFTVFVMAQVYRAIADRIETDPLAVLTRQVALSSVQKVALVARLAWRHWRGRHVREIAAEAV
jgi:phytoene synthase